jgi:LmbE family N-acetylglucosaminyl deacetylase
MIDFNGKRILLVVAHPDDEVLGIGGTIHLLVNQYNVQARALILGEGITSRSDQRNPEEWEKELETHKQNIEDAGKQIGYERIDTYNFPDNRFDSTDLLDLVKVIENIKADFQPEIIFTHHGGDTNIDHQRTFNAVMTASRPQEGEPVKTILTFETPSSTEWQAFNYAPYFKPNFFVPLNEVDIDAKIKAMESYEYEKRAFPHPRSPEALKILAHKRGVEVGCNFAEAFMMIRQIAW